MASASCCSCWCRAGLGVFVSLPLHGVRRGCWQVILLWWHSVEAMVYQYDKLFGYGCWMTSIPIMSHILIFLGYSEFPSWLPWQPIQILQYPKIIQQNIPIMVGILVIQQPYPKGLS